MSKMARIRELTAAARRDVSSSSKPSAVTTPAKKPVKVSKFITLAQAISDKSSTALYVMNNTGMLDAKNQRSDIIIGISNSKGVETPVVIKDTWMPVNLAVQAQRKDILSDTMFMRALEANIIRILSTTYAEKELLKPDISDEIQRLHLRDTQEILTATENPEAPATSTGVSMHIVEIFNRIMSPRERLSILKNLSETLTDADLHYIIIKCNNTTEAKIKSFCEKLRLSKRGR